jgi:putative ABC transport system ATP-binding protein
MPQNISAFLQINHLNKQVHSGDSEITILQDVNLSVNKGESVAILGTSGSGKTTLLTLLAGLDTPTSGDIYFEGRCISSLSEEERAFIRMKSVGFIFQSFQLLPTLTALENVMLPLEIQYIPHAEAKTRATEWLTRVGLGQRLNHYPTKLSGGEQQRVAITRAFVTNPSLIFADEMTGNLDTHTGELVSDILFSINQEIQTTLILVTHDDKLASRCQRRFLLEHGVLTQC